MIKECLLAGTGVLFDQHALSLIGFDFKALEDSLTSSLVPQGLAFKDFGFTANYLGNQDVQPNPMGSPINLAPLPVSPNGHFRSSLLSFPSLPSVWSPASVNSGLFSIPSSIIFEIRRRAAHDHPLFNLAVKHAKDAKDCIAEVWDQLHLQRVWWILEVLPMLTTYQRPDGAWVRKRM